jgi:thiamine biosynthesis lipoprotein ApbE
MGYSYKIVYQIPYFAPWTFESDIRRAARRCAQEIDRSLSLYNRSSVINNINNNKRDGRAYRDLSQYDHRTTAGFVGL